MLAAKTKIIQAKLATQNNRIILFYICIYTPFQCYRSNQSKVQCRSCALSAQKFDSSIQFCIIRSGGSIQFDRSIGISTRRRRTRISKRRRKATYCRLVRIYKPRRSAARGGTASRIERWYRLFICRYNGSTAPLPSAPYVHQ